MELITATAVMDIMDDLVKQVSIYSWQLKPLILSCSEPEPFLRAALTNFQAKLILAAPVMDMMTDLAKQVCTLSNVRILVLLWSN